MSEHPNPSDFAALRTEIEEAGTPACNIWGIIKKLLEGLSATYMITSAKFGAGCIMTQNFAWGHAPPGDPDKGRFVQVMWNNPGKFMLSVGDQIYGGEIRDLTITGNKIANGAITTEKIANESITDEKISPQSVNGAKIIDGTVDTLELKNGAVTLAKLNSEVVTEFTCPVFYESATEPAVPPNSWGFWFRPTDSKMFIIVDKNGTQYVVEAKDI